MRFCMLNNKNGNDDLQAKKNSSFFWYAFYISIYRMYNNAHVKINNNLYMSLREASNA